MREALLAAPTMVLSWTMVFFMAALLSDRNLPLASQGLLLFLPLATLWLLPGGLATDRLTRTILLTCAAGIAVTGIYAPLIGVPSLNLGRWANYALAAAMTLAVVCSPVPPRRWIALLGASALTAFLVTLACNLWYGIDAFTLGNVNFIGSTANPMLLAWVVYLVSRNCSDRVAPWRDVIVVVIVLASLTIYVFTAVPGMPRRGIPTAWCAGILAAAAALMWQRHQRAIIALAVVAIAGIAAFTIWKWMQIDVDMRSERMQIYRGCLDAARWLWPTGGGAYSGLLMTTVPLEMARQRGATGGWNFHAHNEVLDVTMNYGAAGLIISTALIALIAWRCLRIADRHERVAASAMVAALIVHAGTDTAYGYLAPTAWAGVLIGFILRCPTDASAGSVRLRGVRVAGWALAVLSAYAGTCELSAVFEHREASNQVRLRTIQRSLNPETVRIEGDELIARTYAAGDMPGSREVLDNMEGKLRHQAALVHYRLILAERREAELGHDNARVAAAALRGLFAGDVREAGVFIGDWSHRAKAIDAADKALLFAANASISRLPFTLHGYQAMVTLGHRRPDLISRLPPRMLVRLAYLDGDKSLAPPAAAGENLNLEDGVDLFCGLYWMAARGKPWPEIAPILESLVHRFGHMQDVATFVLHCVADAEEPVIAEMAERNLRMLTPGLLQMPQAAELSAIASVTRPAQAARVLRLILVRHPEVGVDIVERRCTGLVSSADQVIVRGKIMQLWWLSRRPLQVPAAAGDSVIP